MSNADLQNVKAEWPPNIEKIKFHMGAEYTRQIEDFSVAVPVFTFYPYIYVPTGHELPYDLVAHETTHLRQQEHMTPEVWWDKWLNDTNFRIEQEVEAYANQLHAFDAAPARIRRHMKEQLAADLSSAAYGSVIELAVAESRIRHAVKSIKYQEKNDS